MAIGVVLGVRAGGDVALAEPDRLDASSWFYIWLFRGTPGARPAAVLGLPRRRSIRTLSIGIPFGGPEF